MSKQIKRYILVVLCIMLVGTACAFTLKAGIGVGAWDALAKSFSDLTGIEVGTAGVIFNSCCVFGELLILRKKFKLNHLLQLPLSLLLGTVVNFVLYDLLVFPFDSFVGGIVMFLCASTLAALGVSIIMLLDEVTFALEGLCMAITSIVPIKFSLLRQLVDVVSVIVSVSMTLFLDLPWAIGLGTILGMLTFGPTLGIFMKLFKPILKKYDLLNYE